MSKFKRLVRSRRFWIAVVSAATGCYLFYTGHLTDEAFADWLKTAFLFYGGSIGLEHLVTEYKREVPQITYIVQDDPTIQDDPLDVN